MIHKSSKALIYFDIIKITQLKPPTNINHNNQIQLDIELREDKGPTSKL